jgi:hypothetical protein
MHTYRFTVKNGGRSWFVQLAGPYPEGPTIREKVDYVEGEALWSRRWQGYLHADTNSGAMERLKQLIPELADAS